MCACVCVSMSMYMYVCMYVCGCRCTYQIINILPVNTLPHREIFFFIYMFLGGLGGGGFSMCVEIGLLVYICCHSLYTDVNDFTVLFYV